MTSVPMMDTNLARSGSADAEMRSRQREIEQSRRNLNGGDAKTKEQKLRDSCEGFEAMFIQKIWEGMRASLPQDGLMQSRDEKHWQGMYDQELGKSMARAGGIGLADMMVSQMSRNLQSASDVAAGSLGGRRPMEIAPAPLLVEPEPAAPQTPVVARNAGQASNQTPAPAGTPKAAPTGALGMDMYSDAAAVAPSPEEQADPAAASAAAGTGTGATAMVAPPPEVSSALSSLAALATQAEAARGIGQQTVNHITGQTPPVQTSQTSQVSQTSQTSQVSQTGVAPAQSAYQRGVAPAQSAYQTGVAPAQSAYPQGVDPASVNAPPPVMPSTTPRVPVRTSTNNRGQAPGDDVQHFTRTQRQTGRAARAGSAPSPRNEAAMAPQNSGVEFASNPASRTASPFSGQNLPPATPGSTELVGDIATELLKSQLGAPTVKTRL